MHYNWATLFLGYVNTGHTPHGHESHEIWTSLAMPSINHKLQTRPVVREGDSY